MTELARIKEVKGQEAWMDASVGILLEMLNIPN